MDFENWMCASTNGTATVFGDATNKFSGDLYVGQVNRGYRLTSSAEGKFALQTNNLYSGTDGCFDLMAEFDRNGVFKSGSMTISGTVAGLIPQNRLLFSAKLTDFASSSNLIGFGTNITYCALQIKAYCTSAESVYLALKKEFTGLKPNMSFKSKVASYTTIPAPASLLLLGTGCIGLIGRMRRKLSS